MTFRFSSHAIARYRERTGCNKSDETIMARLAIMLESRVHIGGDKWYSKGWVFAIVGTKVLTVMRPREHRICKRVWAAHQQS